MKKTVSSVYIILAAILWGCIALFFDSLRLCGFSHLQIVFLRTGVAFVLMAAYLLWKDASLFRMRIRDCWMFIGSGIVSLAFFNFSYFNAIELLSPSVAATLLYTAPVFVMLFSTVLFGERITVKKIAALVVTFVGCIFVTGVIGGSFGSLKGIAFGLGSGVGYALYTVFGVYALRRYQTETVTVYTFLFASISVLPLCKPMEMIEIALNVPSKTVLFSLCMGFFSCLLPYLFYTKGLTAVPPSQASIMATLEPVVATVVGVLFLNDELTLVKTVGIVMIIGAVVLLNVDIPKKHKQ